MIDRYNPTIRDRVLHYEKDGGTNQLVRTPLHINYDKKQREMVSPEPLGLRNARLVRNKRHFNAVGSRVLGGSEIYPTHLPVLDVDGGAAITAYRRAHKSTYRLILGGVASRRGEYSPHSYLTELLGDHGITHEVFGAPRGREIVTPFRTTTRRENRRIDREIADFGALGVNAIVLRSNSPIFEGFDSTTDGHSHVYINKEFSLGEHALLLDELTELGILSTDWTAMAKRDGMGIVRTPWTEKKVEHNGSDGGF